MQMSAPSIDVENTGLFIGGKFVDSISGKVKQCDCTTKSDLKADKNDYIHCLCNFSIQSTTLNNRQCQQLIQEQEKNLQELQKDKKKV